LAEKHITYYNLLDAFKTEGCPICNVISKNVENYFDSLIYENINNYKFVERFNSDLGFCDYHSYKFIEYNDGLAIALTYKDVLKEFINLLEHKELKNFSKNSNKNCIICDLIREAEERYINIFKEFINDIEFTSALLQSEGLCIPHLKLLLQNVKKIPQEIIKFHINNYKKAEKILYKYIDSRNASLGNKKPELTQEEKNIVQKSIKIIYGDKNTLHY